MKRSFNSRSRVLLGVFIVAFVATLRSWGADVLVPSGSVWKYLDNGTDQGTAWVSPAFNDSSWASGPAQLGFGDGDEATVVSFGNETNRFITTYFRRTFGVTNSASVTGLTVRLLRDDGGVVYLNGVEIFRSNMPAGAVSFATLALSAAGGADETTNFFAASASPGLLVNGFNTLAVEIHQVNATSSDLSFDLELLANVSGVTNPPAVAPTIVTQPQSQTVNAGANVTFNVVATGTPPLRYRWLYNGAFVPGATNPVLSLFNVQPANSGSYSVAVSNNVGIVFSSNAVLQVLASTNTVPTVTLTSPTNGATFAAPATILLNAVVSPPGTAARVEFFAGTNRIAQDFTAPYTQVWSNVPPGSYQLRAVATDSNNTTIASAPVNITVASPSAGLTLISTGAVWRYLDNGSDQGTAWTTPAFDHSAWASGPAQLGYGDGDEATVVSFGPDAANKYITTYFRRNFGVTNLSSITGLTVRLLRDDGGVVYLNGVEVFRSNMPDGPISFNTLAPLAVDESTYVSAAIPRSLLVAGLNVIAVEVHQTSPASSDLSFDLELTAQTSGTTNRVPPTIVTQPQDQTVNVGATASFNVVATGSPPLIYRWRRDGTNIAVTTNGVLTLVNVQAGQAGLYSVVVSNSVGSATSSNALLTVVNVNDPPFARASVSPLMALFPDQTNLFVISPNNSNAPVVLDASLSSDPENDPLEFAWIEEGVVFAMGVLVTNQAEIGLHVITLAADDGTDTSTDSVSFEVITPGDAVDEIIVRIENSALSRVVRRPLIATLAAAQSSFDIGSFDIGVRRLQVFQHKVEMRVAPVDPEFATLLVNAAQKIIDAVSAP